jgi:hypothetical protein
LGFWWPGGGGAIKLEPMRKFWPYAALVSPVIALVVGSYLYHQAPQGMLLYTPAAHLPVRYTPSFQIGFFAAASAQIALYSLLCLPAWLLHKREMMRKAVSLLAVSGVLLGCSLLPERWWSLTSPHGQTGNLRVKLP